MTNQTTCACPLSRLLRTIAGFIAGLFDSSIFPLLMRDSG
jgi:hypothetical protein